MKLSRVLLAAAFLFVGLIGGSDAGQYLIAVRVISAATGGALILAYVLNAPRRHDHLDLAVLVGLVGFLLTCVTSSIPRLSFDAAMTAVAYAAAFYVARDAVSDAAGRRLALAVLGLTGALVAVMFLLLWGAGWQRWMAVPDAGIPPVGLALPPVIYGHHYRIAALVGVLAPACVLLARRPGIWPVGLVGSLASAVVILMSGSRTVWLAAVAAMAVTVLLGARYRPTRGRWTLPLVGIALIAGALLAGQVAQRALTSSTVEGRFEIYAASLDRWLDSPLVGHGPGTYSAQMTLAGYHELLQHGHNAIVQMLVEGGLAGLAGMFIVVAAVVISALQATRRNRVAIAGLTVFAVSCLTDNMSVYGFLIVPLIAWAALASPRQATLPATEVRWVRPAAVVMACVAGLAAAATIASAWAYDLASAAARAGDAQSVVQSLRAASFLDPEYALYQRDLGVWLLADGRTAEARERLGKALEANPADPAAHRAAAIAAAHDGAAEAVDLAEGALNLRDDDAANLLTLAYVSRELGDLAAARDALVRALRFEPRLTASPEWREDFGGDASLLLNAAHQSWAAEPDRDNEHHEVRAWLAAMVGKPVLGGPVTTFDMAAAAVIDCRPDNAVVQLGPTANAAVNARWLLVRIIVGRVDGQPVDDYIAMAGLRWPIVAFMASNEVTGASPFTALAHDAKFYGRRSISPPDGGPVFPSPESGLSAWLRDPIGAADRGAPDSGLATCR
jgi:O-antigen ligase